MFVCNGTDYYKHALVTVFVQVNKVIFAVVANQVVVHLIYYFPNFISDEMNYLCNRCIFCFDAQNKTAGDKIGSIFITMHI